MNIPIPPDIQPFAPFGTAMDVKEDADKTLFYAVLGSINKGSDAEKKASFMVYVWSRKGDTLTLIPIDAPPNNAPRLAIAGGKLMLYGVREEGGVKTAGEWEVPGFVAPQPPLTLGNVAGWFIVRLGDADTPITNAVEAVVRRVAREVWAAVK